MEKEYTLYLDESKSVDEIFVVGGFAIESSKEDTLQNLLDVLKEKTFGKTDDKENKKVFHATDQIKKKKEAFLEMLDILEEVQGIVFACVIKLDELYELYGSKYTDSKNKEYYNFIEDEFFIALQKILENYTHFLFYKKSFGKTVYEGRNSEGQDWQTSPDFLLKKDFLEIIANNKGLSYINQTAVKLCNTHFSVKRKKEDLAGLQIADFIAYIIARYMTKSLNNKDYEEFMKRIYKNCYNGNFSIEEKDLRHFYGIKIIPEMFRYIKGLKELDN